MLARMIFPNEPQYAADVGGHYDELDETYRSIWGEHVHHGYWRTGRETPEEATEALVGLVAERLELSPGQKLVDIGCGYGATAALLAARHGVAVTGFTLSEAQWRIAAARAGALDFKCRDWLDNGLPDASFDRAYAIESSEHMVDKPRFFAEVARTLKPRGRFANCVWLSSENPSPAAINHLLEPICREGRLPSMGSESEYRAMMRQAGLEVIGFEDLTAKVWRTWFLCLTRAAKGIVTDRSYRTFLLDPRNSDRSFAVTLLRILWAYRSGAMRYGLFAARKA